jgi:hypothetical protein
VTGCADAGWVYIRGIRRHVFTLMQLHSESDVRSEHKGKRKDRVTLDQEQVGKWWLLLERREKNRLIQSHIQC